MDLTMSNELTRPYRIPRKKIEDNGAPKKEYRSSPYAVVEVKKEIKQEPLSSSKSTQKRRHEERKHHGGKRRLGAGADIAHPSTSGHSHPGPSGVNTPDAHVVDKIFGEMRTSKLREKSVNSPETPRADGDRTLTRAELQRHMSDDKACYDFMKREGLMERILGHKMLTGRVESHLNMGYIKVEASNKEDNPGGSSGLGSLAPPPPQPIKGIVHRGPRTPPESPRPKQPRRGPRTPPGSPGPTTPPPPQVPPPMHTPSNRISPLLQAPLTHIPPPPREYNTPPPPVPGGISDSNKIMQDLIAATGVPASQLQGMMDEEMKRTLNSVSPNVILETIRNAIRGINQIPQQPHNSRNEVSDSAHSVGMDVESDRSATPPPPPPIMRDSSMVLQAPPPPPTLPPMSSPMMQPPMMNIARLVQGPPPGMSLAPPIMQAPPTMTSTLPPPPIMGHPPPMYPPPQVNMAMPPPMVNMSMPPPLHASPTNGLSQMPPTINGNGGRQQGSIYGQGGSYQPQPPPTNGIGSLGSVPLSQPNPPYGNVNGGQIRQSGMPTSSHPPTLPITSSQMQSPSTAHSTPARVPSSLNTTQPPPSFVIGNQNEMPCVRSSSNVSSSLYSAPPPMTEPIKLQVKIQDVEPVKPLTLSIDGTPKATSRKTSMSGVSRRAGLSSNRNPRGARTSQSGMGRGGKGPKHKGGGSTPVRPSLMGQPMQQNIQATLLSALGLGGGPKIPSQFSSAQITPPLLDRYGQPLPVPDRLRSEAVPVSGVESALSGFGSGTGSTTNDFTGRGRNY